MSQFLFLYSVNVSCSPSMEPFYLFTDMESFKEQELANFKSMRS